jgi:hypothetical protein
MRLYPPAIRSWIERHGGLTPRHHRTLRGRELAALYPPASRRFAAPALGCRLSRSGLSTGYPGMPMRETPQPHNVAAAHGGRGGDYICARGHGLALGPYGTTVFFETIRAGFIACFG